MKQVLKDGLSYTLSLLAKLAAPTVERWLSNWTASLFSDLPMIGGAWVARFDEPADDAVNPQNIDAVLRQFGRRIEGIAHVQGEPGDPFVFRGRVRRNVFYGVFKREDRRVLAGAGTFFLKVAADSRAMSGVCSWYDSDLDEVWSSPYAWTRKGGPRAGSINELRRHGPSQRRRRGADRFVGRFG